MGYRDEGDALLQRIATLERQAARAEQLERRVRELERENQQLRAAVSGAQGADEGPAATTGAAIRVDHRLLDYIEALVEAAREPQGIPSLQPLAKHLLSGPRPRAARILLEQATAKAVEHGRGYLLPADIRAVAPAVLASAVLLVESARAANITAQDYVQRVLDAIEVP